MLLGTFGASLLGNRSAGKGTIRADEITIRTGHDFLFRLTNFEIRTYYQNEPKFYGFYSRNNSLKVKDGEYVINLDEYKSIETHWIALNMNEINIVHFDKFWSSTYSKRNLKIYGREKYNGIHVECKHTIR